MPLQIWRLRRRHSAVILDRYGNSIHGEIEAVSTSLERLGGVA